MNETPQLLDYNDYPAVREDLRARMLQAVQGFQVENDQYTLRVSDVDYRGARKHNLKAQKEAILGGKTLSDKLVGRYELVDNASGDVVNRTGIKTLLNVPYITPRGTYIRNGTEYTIAKQLRLVPGVFTRKTDDGLVEAQFNSKPRSGPGFRTYLEPDTGNFYLRYRRRKIPLYPVLRAMGYTHEQLASTWGSELAVSNRKLEKSPYAVNFLRQFRTREAVREELLGLKPLVDKAAAGEIEYSEEIRQNLLDEFGRTELDPRTTEITLGRPYERVSPEVIAVATRKLLQVQRGQADTDSRDSLAFQEVNDVADFLDEKIRNDQNGVARQLLWKIAGKGGDLSRIPTGLLDKHVSNLFNESGMSQAVEEINPLDMFDQNQSVTRLGEGAMSSVDVVPKDARNLQPSYMGYIDPVRSPESMKIGVDMRFARDVRRGPGKQLYTRFQNPRTQKDEWVSAWDATRSVIAFPGAMQTKDKFVPAMVGNKGMQYVDKGDVDYVIKSGDDMFSHGANLVPLKSGIKGMRLLMGSKFGVQALPLVSREAPLVQTAEKGSSVEHRLGEHMGAVRASKDSVVSAVYKDHIVLGTGDDKENVDLYDTHPFARKTSIRNNPVVKAGQRVKAGDLLATSNFTDAEGTAALGTNMRVAYLNYDGKVFEDAVVISESAAQRLTSEHMYHIKNEDDKTVTRDKEKYRGLFPSKFNKKQLDSINSEGFVRSGTVVQHGDPMILAVEERDPSQRTLGRKVRKDVSTTWEHHFPGVVIDAVQGRRGIHIGVRANIPMQVGDKLSNRFGAKGVVSEIVPDVKMPADSKGRPFDVLLSPQGIVTRTNPAQKLEVQLGKIAAKTGKPYRLPGFTDNRDESLEEFVSAELRRHRLSDTEDIQDPRTGKTIPEVFTGVSYFYKLQHTAEGKGKSRATARYTAEDQPARGGKEGAKHYGDMELQALLAHGADEVLKDLKLITGQKNDAFWRQLKLGQTPSMPGSPEVYTKFRSLLKAAGVNLTEDASGDHIFAMTDAEAKELTGNREITSSSTLGDKNMAPIPGGLFDPESTGSLVNGDRWGYISLPEAFPNPLMEEPMRRILGMTRKEFDAAVASDEGGGGQSFKQRLSRVNLGAEKARALDTIKSGAKTKRDDAVKRFRYIDAMEKMGVKPSDFMMTRVPVLPPRFRPIIRQNSLTMVADPNYLYKALLDSSRDYKDTEGLPAQVREEARGGLYQAYRSLVGVVDPEHTQLQQKGVRGILHQIFGKGSPKFGFIQRRVVGTNIDVSGLGVVTPNPALKLNQIGMPEPLAWDLYEPFVVRELVQRGVPATQAAKAVAEHSPAARDALTNVIETRPVLVNRAPSLHKYSIMAFEPVLTKGSTVQVPPAVVGPFAMDFDGDTASFTVPVSDAAVRQAKEKMMPTKHLLDARHGKATYSPSNEYLQGLYLATKIPTKKPVRTFKSRAAAVEAYRKGDIRIDDPITIVED